MHTYGLYTGRYGLSDKIFLNLIPDELRADVDEMLAAETVRQERLKSVLGADDADHAADDFLLHAYKQLQFFDTLSLYFHADPEGGRGDSTFENVPRNVLDDVPITVAELGDGRYSVSPYPFDIDELTVSTDGRYLAPQPSGTDLATVLADTDVSQQTVTLVGT